MGLMQTLLLQLSRGAKLTPSEAGKMLSRPRRTMQEALSRLVRRGLAVSMGGRYACAPQGVLFMESGGEIRCGSSAPRKKIRVVEGTVRNKTWRAMRIKGKFSLDDLARAVLDGTEAGQDPTDNIRKYAVALQKAGYLIEMKKRITGSSIHSNGSKRWMLARDTGPKAPIARQTGDVWDQNEEKLYARGAS